MSDIARTALAELTADLVGAYVSNNALPVSELPALIQSVHGTLSKLGTTASTVEPELKPAVNPKKTVFPDYIISLEDGKQYRTLKRHLGTQGMTPDEYRAKWKLPTDYPMVAANYSAQRSALARSTGLGRKPGAKVTAAAAPKGPPAKRVKKV